MKNAKEELLEVLKETRELLALPDNDFGWSSWDNVEDALAEFDQTISSIEADRYSRFSKLTTLFAPTGSIQEVSVSSGWGKKFIEVSEKFDTALRHYLR